MSSFTLPRWFSRTNSSKKKACEGVPERVYTNVDYTNRPLPRPPPDEASAGPSRNFGSPSPPAAPTLEAVVEARARLRKTVSVDEGIESAAAWMRPGDRRGIHLVSRMDSLPEPPPLLPGASGPDFFPGEVSGLTYANVTVTQAVVERADDSSSSHDSVFYDPGHIGCGCNLWRQKWLITTIHNRAPARHFITPN